MGVERRSTDRGGGKYYENMLYEILKNSIKREKVRLTLHVFQRLPVSLAVSFPCYKYTAINYKRNFYMPLVEWLHGVSKVSNTETELKPKITQMQGSWCNDKYTTNGRHLPGHLFSVPRLLCCLCPPFLEASWHHCSPPRYLSHWTCSQGDQQQPQYTIQRTSCSSFQPTLQDHFPICGLVNYAATFLCWPCEIIFSLLPLQAALLQFPTVARQDSVLGFPLLSSSWIYASIFKGPSRCRPHPSLSIFKPNHLHRMDLSSFMSGNSKITIKFKWRKVFFSPKFSGSHQYHYSIASTGRHGHLGGTGLHPSLLLLLPASPAHPAS